MKKEIKVVYGLIYDDELNKRMGLNRFYHLNGDIETDADGNEETKQIEDVAERVDNLSVALQKFIERYTQIVDCERNAKFIGVNLSELV
jgi:hypothetical protein